MNKHFISWLSTFNWSSIISNCMYTTMRKSNIMTYVNNLFTFFKSVYYV